MRPNFRKINVVGASGSGKTTFSKSLSCILGFEHIEIDSVFWGPNWHHPSDEEFYSDLKQSLKNKDSWILDGNYTRTIPIKWENVELVIWLDYSFTRTLIQALIRAFMRSLTKKELWEGTGNRETFKKSFFSRDSIIFWTIRTHSKVRLKYERLMNDPEFSNITFVRLRSPLQSRRFLKDCKCLTK